MKKFEFSLERLKQYREQVEETEKNKLGELRAQLRILEAETEELLALIEKKNDDLRELYRHGAFPHEISSLNRFISLKQQELHRKRRDIILKNEEIAAQLTVVIDSRREVSKLEKLEEHQLEDYRFMEKKEQEKFIEEFVANAEFNKNK